MIRMKITVAHDLSCAWCWIGLSQAKRLRAEFGIEIEWRGYELFPEDMEWPDGDPAPAGNPDKPATPSRFALALAAEGLAPVATGRPKKMKTFRAHQALELARDRGCHDALLDRLYRAHWVHGLNINEIEGLKLLIKGLPIDEAEMVAAIESRRYLDRLVMFDDPAYASGVYNVPTFFIGGERYAEQPYGVLRDAVAKQTEGVEVAWDGIAFPPAPADRPYIFLNMVSTLDGKIVTGERNEPVQDLGSKVDHRTMRYLESLADSVLVGAGNVRATPKMRFDVNLMRFVATRHGVDRNHNVFLEAPDRAFMVGPLAADDGGLAVLAGKTETDWPKLLRRMREELGVEVLLCEGGAELNAELFRLGLIDEVFLTVAPKVKLGRDIPTVAGGEPLTRAEVQQYRLLASRTVGDEVFLRYQRGQ